MPRENSPRKCQKDGRYSWMALAAVFYFGTLVSGHNSNFGILLPEYVDEFQVSKAQITVIQSLFNGAMAGFGKFSYLNTLNSNNSKHKSVGLI